jgi:hypothetical protein
MIAAIYNLITTLSFSTQNLLRVQQLHTKAKAPFPLRNPLAFLKPHPVSCTPFFRYKYASINSPFCHQMELPNSRPKIAINYEYWTQSLCSACLSLGSQCVAGETQTSFLSYLRSQQISKLKCTAPAPGYMHATSKVVQEGDIIDHSQLPSSSPSVLFESVQALKSTGKLFLHQCFQ